MVQFQTAARVRRLSGVPFAAAALIRAICSSANPPEGVAQSCLGFALQRGQTKDIGLTDWMSGPGS